MSVVKSIPRRPLLIAALMQALIFCALGGPAAALVPAAPNDAQLTVSRVFASPQASDTLQFSVAPQKATLVSASVFGVSDLRPLSEKNPAPTKPLLFAAMTESSYSSYDQPGLKAEESAAVAAVRFRLFGGQQTLAFETAGKDFQSAPLLNNPAAGPALFAFYNFPQLAQLPDNAAAASLAAPQVNGSASLSMVSFPGLDALKQQADPGFNGLLSNSRGTAVEFRFPLVFSGVKASLRLNGQSQRGVDPHSLATQIFGPAFASSVTRKYNSLGGGVTLALPLFDRKATVSLDGLYESLKRNDKSSFLYAANASYLANNPEVTPYSAAASTSLGAISAPSALYFYPNFIDIRRFASGASLAVPITKAITVNGGFSEQRLNGVALNTLTQDLSQRSRSIGGGLVYNIPKTNSSIDLFFNRYKYFDDVVPASNRTENRQNIYFSVKF